MLKLKPMAFANSLAVLSGAFYVVMLILAKVAAPAYKYFFNAQFLGANVAPLNPVFHLGLLVTLVVMGWVMGYVWAWLYNLWAK